MYNVYIVYLRSQLGTTASELGEQMQELDRRSRNISASDDRIKQLAAEVCAMNMSDVQF